MTLIYRVLVLFCLLISSSQAQEISLNLKNCLQGKTIAHIPLDTMLGNYIEGEIKLTELDLNHEGATLSADIGGQNRLLFRDQIDEESFSLWLGDEKHAALTLQAPHNTALCYELDLNYGHGQYNQPTQFNSNPKSPRLQRLQQQLQQSSQPKKLLEKFWQTIQSLPLIEPMGTNHKLLTFLWRGSELNVRLVLAQRLDLTMQQLPDSDIWFKSIKVENDADPDHEFIANTPTSTPKSPRLQALQQQLQQSSASKQLLQAFWQIAEEQGTPLVEPLDDNHKLVTFLWRGAKHHVHLLDVPGNTDSAMQQLAGTDIWFNSVVIENDARFSYEIAADYPLLEPKVGLSDKENAYRLYDAYQSTALADPLNPKHFGHSSLVDLSNAKESIVLDRNTAVAGHLQQYAFTSQILANQRRIWLYQTDEDIADNSAVDWLYLFDGEEYINLVNAPAILDKLRQEGKIGPLIAVLIDNASGDARGKELPPNQAFADMLAYELIPFVEAKTGRQHNGRQTVLAGSSYGGLATAYVASRYPHYFGKVLPMSGSFWWPEKNNNAIAYLYQNSPVLPLQWFIVAGTYETGIIETSQELATVLQKKGYAITFKEYHADHDYALWQQTLYDGLSALLGRE